MKNRRNSGLRRAAAVLVCLMTALPSAPGAYAAGSADGRSDAPAEGTYVPGEVIVMFEPGAVGDSSASVKSVRALSAVGDDYGMMQAATGDEREAAADAESEAAIIGRSLGDDFEISDSLTFPAPETAAEAADGDGQLNAQGADPDAGEITVALVKSDTLGTEELIKKLSANKRIAAAEPNSYISYEAYDEFSDYSLNDTYSGYLYQANDAAAENRAGDSVDPRGGKTGGAISTNAASAWKELSGNEEETVVAVVDTGVNPDHEDLKNMLWTNPGDIGLAGEHGYNFANNNTDITDHMGHGTHCAGIIAAEANNGKGVAGITAGANVKIMVLNTNGDGESPSNLFTAMGSFNYVIKAKQRGVNVVATSNSWGRSDTDSTVFNTIIDRMGQEGILTFIAAGNDERNLDNATFNPASNDSDYSICVGSGKNNGEAAGYSNYGKAGVDLFAPGNNILSAAGESIYFPTIYSKEQLRETTEYYGAFKPSTPIIDNTVRPDNGMDSVIGGKAVKAFGKARFRKQEKEYTDDIDWEIPDDAECELAIDTEHYFGIKNKASLRVTIRNAHYGEEYYLYFPYTKNEATTGSDNTQFSIFYESGDVGNEAYSEIYGGEVIEGSDGVCALTGYGLFGHTLSDANRFLDTHIVSPTGEAPMETILPYDELEEGQTAGIGLMVTPSAGYEKGNVWTEEGEAHDLVFYIDSIALSRPDIEIDPDSSYEMMSGTSMACPAAAAAGALVAALYPQPEGMSGADYAAMIRNRLFSCVRQTDSLRDKCSTGGFIDLRLLKAGSPVINDAVCDLNKGSITLKGANMSALCELTYRRLACGDSQEVKLPSGKMTPDYAPDGSSVVIANARELFGTFTEFTMKDRELKGTGSFFLVKGHKPLKQIASEIFKDPEDPDYTGSHDLHLLTDADGHSLFAYENDTGVLYRLTDGEFVQLPGTNIKDTFRKKLAEDGYNEYEAANDFEISVDHQSEVFNSGNMVYHMLSAEYASPGSDSDDHEYLNYIASLDLTAKKPAWTFREFTPIYYSELPEQYADDSENLTFSQTVIGNRLYCLGSSMTKDRCLLFSMDLDTLEWRNEAELPTGVMSPTLAEYRGDLYVFFGFRRSGNKNVSPAEMLSGDVWRFDGRAWKKTGYLKYSGKYASGTGVPDYVKSCTEAANGLVFLDTAVEGAGNSFIYDPDRDSVTPLYYTLNDSFSDDTLYGVNTMVSTRDGIYYLRDCVSETEKGWTLWELPLEWGDYESKYGDEPAAPDDAAAASLSLSSVSLSAGGSCSLSVRNGSVRSWSSSNAGVASVSNGRVTALKKGAAVISATLADGGKLSCTVKVTSSPKLSKKSVTVKKGKTVTVRISGKAAGTSNSYSKTRKAKVVSKKTASKIKVKGLKRGRTTLKIKVNGVTLKLKVRVR